MGKKTRQQTFYFENLGCAKNQVDGEALCAELLGKGWLLADEPEQADYLLVNTCSPSPGKPTRKVERRTQPGSFSRRRQTSSRFSS